MYKLITYAAYGVNKRAVYERVKEERAVLDVLTKNLRTVQC